MIMNKFVAIVIEVSLILNLVHWNFKLRAPMQDVLYVGNV